MIDKRLFRLLGENRRYVGYCVALQLASLAASLTVTACLCRAIYLAAQKNFPETGAFFILAAAGFAAMAVRYLAVRKAGDLKDLLGRKAKQDLREKVYDKIVRLGVRSADGMSMAGMTQVALEGVEQLDLYYSSYLPQFFYAMLAPLVLFSVTVWIDWRVAAALLVCVPLIPLSIVAVSRYAKRIFAKYWGQYISMGDAFLDSVQGLRELKLFRADARQHQRMNAAGGVLSQDHHEGAGNAAGQHYHYGPGSLRRSGSRHCTGAAGRGAPGPFPLCSAFSHASGSRVFPATAGIRSCFSCSDEWRQLRQQDPLATGAAGSRLGPKDPGWRRTALGGSQLFL